MQYDRETLVAAIRERGINYLAPSDAKATNSFTSEADFIVALLNHPDPRLPLSLVNLFILRPDLAEYVPGLVKDLPAAPSLDLQTLYMAAVYLQRLWHIHLSLYLDKIVLLPDLYSGELNLPPADERFGKAGLHALAESWSARSSFPFDRLASLNKAMDLLFEQLKMERPLYEPASIG